MRDRNSVTEKRTRQSNMHEKHTKYENNLRSI